MSVFGCVCGTLQGTLNCARRERNKWLCTATCTREGRERRKRRRGRENRRENGEERREQRGEEQTKAWCQGTGECTTVTCTYFLILFSTCVCVSQCVCVRVQLESVRDSRRFAWSAAGLNRRTNKSTGKGDGCQTRPQHDSDAGQGILSGGLARSSAARVQLPASLYSRTRHAPSKGRGQR